MGGRQSQLTEEELQDYKDLTYLSRREILHAFGRFKDLSFKEVNEDPKIRLPAEVVRNMSELKNNPFSDRLCSVYSSSNDGKLSFEDFLDMISVFSEEAPLEKKAAYAFKLYDFDNDGFLNKEDVSELINRLTSGKMTPSDQNLLIKKVFLEADLDQDEQISPMEFEHVILKSPDFAGTFQLKL